MQQAKVEAGLIACLRALPAGAKPRQAALRSEIGCSTDELRGCIQSMRYKGKLHWERLELAGSLLIDPAPKQEDELSGGAALAAKVREAAKQRGVTLKDFLAPITPNHATWLRQLEQAKSPREATVERVMALINGEALTAVLPPTGGEIGQRKDADDIADRLLASAEEKHAEEERRRQSHRAHEVRRPGESVADAARRAAEGAALRAELARTSASVKGNRIADRLRAIGAEVDAEEAAADEARRNAELEALASPSSLLRRAQRDWPEQCGKVRALAAELGVGLAEAWHRVIKAGLDCLAEDEAEAAHG